MIHCRLLEMMAKHGIRFVSRLADETGINRRTLATLVDDRMLRYDADVLERLCAFFDCQPGDLLEFRDEEAELPAGSAQRLGTSGTAALHP